MVFLNAIRNSINNTTEIFEKKISGRWGFFTLAYLTFGVIQILGLIVFYFAYFKIVEPVNGGMNSLLDAPEFDTFFYYGSYGSGLIYLFLVQLLHIAHSQPGVGYSFGKAFAKIKLGIFVWYLLSLVLVQFLAIYFSRHTEYAFDFYIVSDSNPLTQLMSEFSWYEHLMYSGMLYVIELLPWIVIACYTLYLRHSNFNLSLLWKNRGYVLAMLMIILAFFGLTDYVWHIITNFIIGSLSYAFVNEAVPLIINLCVYLAYGAFCFGIAGYLLYFTVFDRKENDSSQPLINEPSKDILDQ